MIRSSGKMIIVSTMNQNVTCSYGRLDFESGVSDRFVAVEMRGPLCRICGIQSSVSLRAAPRFRIGWIFEKCGHGVDYYDAFRLVEDFNDPAPANDLYTSFSILKPISLCPYPHGMYPTLKGCDILEFQAWILRENGRRTSDSDAKHAFWSIPLRTRRIKRENPIVPENGFCDGRCPVRMQHSIFRISIGGRNPKWTIHIDYTCFHGTHIGWWIGVYCVPVNP